MSAMAPVDPHDVLGWTIVMLGVVATAVAFTAAIVLTLSPGESAIDHPKRLILDERR